MKRYFEFNKQDYYGLIAVKVNEGESVKDSAMNATEVYVGTIGGDTVEQILSEGKPEIVSKEYAFWKLANCNGVGHMTLDELLREFNSFGNTCVVMDGSLD